MTKTKHTQNGGFGHMVRCVIGMGFCLGSMARAEVLAYEPFDYQAGKKLEGRSGGKNFQGVWRDNQFNASEKDVIEKGSLAFRNLETRGNSAKLASSRTSGSTGVRKLNRILPEAGTTTWVSFLLRMETPGSSDGFPSSAYLALRPDGGGASPRFGVVDLPWGIRLFGIGSNRSRSQGRAFSWRMFSRQKTYFLVASISWDANKGGRETVRLFVNPKPGSKEPKWPAAIRRDLNIADKNGRNALRFLVLSASGTGAGWVFDEIRVGSKFIDVAPQISRL